MKKMKVKIFKLTCAKCGHQWVPTQEVIKMCPQRDCRTRLWEKHEPKTWNKPETLKRTRKAKV